MTLGKFIEESGCRYDLSNVELFLIQSRILTKYKMFFDNGDPGIDYSFMTNDLGISKNFARRLIHSYQISLSKFSCEFIHKINVDCSIPLICSNLLNDLQKRDDDGRYILPSFFIMKVIYGHIMRNGGLIQVNIKRLCGDNQVDFVTLVFEFDVYNNCLSQVSHIDKVSGCPALVFDGDVNYGWGECESKGDYIARFLKVCFGNILFLNMASHPQYSGERLKSISKNPIREIVDLDGRSTYCDFENNFLAMRRAADLLGCSANNTSLFHLVHVHCDKVELDVNSFFERENCSKYTIYNEGAMLAFVC